MLYLDSLFLYPHVYIYIYLWPNVLDSNIILGCINPTCGLKNQIVGIINPIFGILDLYIKYWTINPIFGLSPIFGFINQILGLIKSNAIKSLDL